MIQHSYTVGYAKIDAQKHNFEQSIWFWFSMTSSGENSHVRLFSLASCGTLGRCLQNPWVPWNPNCKSLQHSIHYIP